MKKPWEEARMTTELDRKTAHEKYGPWVVIAGGSDGTGEAYARQLAALGLNIMIVSRREEVLTALANDLRTKHGVETRILVQDLMAPDAAANMLKACADLDVGLYISNAGVDGTGSHFFNEPVERWKRMAQMNVITVLEAIHGFGNRLRERGRGGMLIMVSMSALSGTPYLSMYSSTKAFEMTLVEALWGELLQYNVEMSGVLAPLMNTPMYQREMAGEDFNCGPFIFECDEIARECLARLGKQPLIVFPVAEDFDPREFERVRYEALLRGLESGKTFFRKGQKVET
jgi:short-subunit dehydrogenase